MTNKWIWKPLTDEEISTSNELIAELKLAPVVGRLLVKREVSADCRTFTSRTLFWAVCSFFARAIAMRVGNKVTGAIDVRAFDWCAF